MFTQFVKRGIAPVLLILIGLSGTLSEFSVVLLIAGGIWEAFNVAKLLDARRMDAMVKQLERETPGVKLTRAQAERVLLLRALAKEAKKARKQRDHCPCRHL